MITTTTLEVLSKNRTKLMGVATIGVIAIHSIDFGVKYPEILRKILHFGLYGVDIFLLCSGLGLYYSMEKSTRKVFYKKRIRRVFIPYLTLSIPLAGIIGILGHRNFWIYLGDVSTISYWIKGRGAWYVAMLIPLYVVYPFIYREIEKLRYSKVCLGIIAITITYSSFLCDKINTNEILNNLLLIYRRLPVFFIGWIIGILIREHKVWTKCDSIIVAIISMIFWFASLKVGVPLIVSQYCWFAIGISYLISFIMEVIDWKITCLKIINNICTVVGTISLEMYLCNIYFISIFNLMNMPNKFRTGGAILFNNFD